VRWQKQFFVHTLLSRAYLALARLSCIRETVPQCQINSRLFEPVLSSTSLVSILVYRLLSNTILVLVFLSQRCIMCVVYTHDDLGCLLGATSLTMKPEYVMLLWLAYLFVVGPLVSVKAFVWDSSSESSDSSDSSDDSDDTDDGRSFIIPLSFFLHLTIILSPL